MCGITLKREIDGLSLFNKVTAIAQINVFPFVNSFGINITASVSDLHPVRLTRFGDVVTKLTLSRITGIALVVPSRNLITQRIGFDYLGKSSKLTFIRITKIIFTPAIGKCIGGSKTQSIISSYRFNCVYNNR